VIGDVATMRDQSRIAVHNATKQPAGYTVVLPNVGRVTPQITHRQLTAGDDTIDL
jgi:hypothetical protein